MKARIITFIFAYKFIMGQTLAENEANPQYYTNNHSLPAASQYIGEPISLTTLLVPKLKSHIIYVLTIQSKSNTQDFNELNDRNMEENRCDYSSGLKLRDSLHMSSFMSSSLKDDCSKSKTKGDGQVGSSLISWRPDKNG